MNPFQFVSIRYTVDVSTMNVVGLLSVLDGWMAGAGKMINVSIMNVVGLLSVSRVLDWLAAV